MKQTSIFQALLSQEKDHPQPVPYYRFFYLLSKLIKPNLCVELGTNRGVAAACLALGNPEGKVITLDIEGGKVYPECKLNNIEFLIQDSLAPIRDGIKDIDILFIDTSSKGTQNKNEYDHWISRVKPNGLVFIDDIYIVQDKDGSIKTDFMADFWNNFNPEGEKLSLGMHGENGFGAVVLNKKQKNISHTRLKNIHLNKDIYVLGSGSSMNFIDKSFLKDKISIGSNSIWKFFPVTYSLFKHKEFIDEAVKNNQKVIIAKHDCGDIRKEIVENKNSDYIFTHKKGRFEDMDANFNENINAIGKDEDIFVSYSTITSCIHLAAYMGAKNIIILGHDCGFIDGVSHVKNYAQHLIDFHKTEKAFNDYHNMWFKIVSQDTIRLKQKLKEVYGCNIYSINPFINFGLEGHKYDTKKQ